MSLPSRWPGVSAAVLFTFLLTILSPAHADSKLDQQLAYRAWFGTAAEIRTLLKQGANPNSLDPRGTPVLAVAAKRHDGEGLPIAKLLLQNKADVNAVDSSGETALFHAAREGNEAMVKLLLENNVAYYQARKDGNIARAVANERGYDNIVKLMDDFVNNQRETAMAAYEAQNEQTRAMYEKSVSANAQKKADAAAKATAAQQAAEQAAEKAAEEARIAKEKADAEARAAAEEKRRQLAELRNPKRLQRLIYDTAYNACIRNYWEYTGALDIAELPSKTEREKLMEKHGESYTEAAGALIKDFNVKPDYIENITGTTRNHLISELDAIRQSFSLRAKGVGTAKDSENRCASLASAWEAPADLNPPAAARKPEHPVNPQKAAAAAAEALASDQETLIEHAREAAKSINQPELIGKALAPEQTLRGYNPNAFAPPSMQAKSLPATSDPTTIPRGFSSTTPASLLPPVPPGTAQGGAPAFPAGQQPANNAKTPPKASGPAPLPQF